MKRLSLFIVLVVAVGNAYASCPTAPTTHQAFPRPYVDWTQDSSCYSLSSGVSGATVSCYYGAGWEFDSASTVSASTTFTAQSGYVLNTNGWSAASFVEFDSPSSSAYDWIELRAIVSNGGGSTSHQLFYWNGTMGTLSGCAQQYGTFSASAGDTVQIVLYAANPHGATIRASIPRIFNQ